MADTKEIWRIRRRCGGYEGDVADKKEMWRIRRDVADKKDDPKLFLSLLLSRRKVTMYLLTINVDLSMQEKAYFPACVSISVCLSLLHISPCLETQSGSNAICPRVKSRQIHTAMIRFLLEQL